MSEDTDRVSTPNNVLAYPIGNDCVALIQRELELTQKNVCVLQCQQTNTLTHTRLHNTWKLNEAEKALKVSNDPQMHRRRHVLLVCSCDRADLFNFLVNSFDAHIV